MQMNFKNNDKTRIHFASLALNRRKRGRACFARARKRANLFRFYQFARCTKVTSAGQGKRKRRMRRNQGAGLIVCTACACTACRGLRSRGIEEARYARSGGGAESLVNGKNKVACVRLKRRGLLTVESDRHSSRSASSFGAPTHGATASPFSPACLLAMKASCSLLSSAISL